MPGNSFANVCLYSIKNISVVLFDLDGTIADTNALILRAIADTLEHQTGRSWQREELLQHWGMRLRDQLTLLHPSIDADSAIAYYRLRYGALSDLLLAEFPGMRDLLERLRASHYHLGVVTSKKRQSALETLECLGYRHYFSDVVVEEDTQHHKPSPEPLLYALKRFNMSADRALYVGDNPDDIVAAHAAGMAGIAVGWGLRPRIELAQVGADVIIEHPAMLLELLRGSYSSQVTSI